MKRLVFVVVLLGLFSTSATAQFETGTVVGTIKDSTGAVVPGAKVTLTNTQTGVTSEKTSDANGSYEFFTVRPGAFEVTDAAGARVPLHQSVYQVNGVTVAVKTPVRWICVGSCGFIRSSCRGNRQR